MCRVLFVSVGMWTVKDFTRWPIARGLPNSRMLSKHSHRAHCDFLPDALDFRDHDLLGDSNEFWNQVFKRSDLKDDLQNRPVCAAIQDGLCILLQLLHSARVHSVQEYRPGSVFMPYFHFLCEVEALLQSADVALGRALLRSVRMDQPCPTLYIDHFGRQIHWLFANPVLGLAHHMCVDLHKTRG